MLRLEGGEGNRQGGNPSSSSAQTELSWTPSRINIEAQFMHGFSAAATASSALNVMFATSGKNLRNLGGTSGAEQFDP